MNILQVNNTDLPGHIFNGHDLQISLNDKGYTAFQAVTEKLGTSSTTILIKDQSNFMTKYESKQIEKMFSMNNLIVRWDKQLMQHTVFLNADIVHYHLIHNHLISLLNFPLLTHLKPSIWTIHDLWAITGHCIQPVQCKKWETGCLECPTLNDDFFPMKQDKASQMWNIKKRVYKDLNVDIVVSTKFLENYIKNSPLTRHFKHIHRIPFGIDISLYENVNKLKARKRFGISKDNFVIGFRNENNEIKGCKYIFKMLDNIKEKKNITVFTTGNGILPENIKEKYKTIELGWQNDNQVMIEFFGVCDVFLMPSIAESFGLMAIEAMASGCPVVCFENTVLTEITFSPICGIAVPYKSSNGLKAAVLRLMSSPDECKYRGEKGIELVKKHYSFDDYVNKHIELYHEILNRKQKERM